MISTFKYIAENMKPRQLSYRRVVSSHIMQIDHLNSIEDECCCLYVASFDAIIVVPAHSLRKILEILSHRAGSIIMADPHTLE